MQEMRKTKEQKAFDCMELKTDEKGQEYLSYKAFGGMPVKDYSPWTIKKYKEYKGV